MNSRSTYQNISATGIPSWHGWCPGRGPHPAMGGRVRGWTYDGDTISMMAGVDSFAWDPGCITHGATMAGAVW